MPTLTELAGKQIKRQLGRYPDGLTASELFLKLDNSINGEEFDAALEELRSSRELREDNGVFFLISGPSLAVG